MWSRIFAGIVASAVFTAPSGQAMSAPDEGQCRVVNAEKLPPESGGAAAMCSTIEQAIAVRAPKVRYRAEVRVLSQSGLAVKVEVAGRKLPEQHFAIMDRNINPGFVKRAAE